MSQRKGASYHYHLLTLNDRLQDLAKNVCTSSMPTWEHGAGGVSCVHKHVQGTCEHKSSLGTQDNLYMLVRMPSLGVGFAFHTTAYGKKFADDSWSREGSDVHTCHLPTHSGSEIDLREVNDRINMQVKTHEKSTDTQLYNERLSGN